MGTRDLHFPVYLYVYTYLSPSARMLGLWHGMGFYTIPDTGLQISNVDK